jgi:hypothetical protein
MSLKLLHHVIRDIEITKYITKQIQMYSMMQIFPTNQRTGKDLTSQIFVLARATHP